jgi:pyruvate formate lyase activating enzyme
MRIGGLLKFSLIDYPGKVAAVVFTAGCNYRCPFCHNPELVLPELFNTPISTDDILAFLEKRIGQLQGVVVTGGEPTIHDDLPDFLFRIKSLGYCVKLDTNGSRPDVLSVVIDRKLVDFIAMDIKSSPESYCKATGVAVDISIVKASIDLIRESGLRRSFLRTTFWTSWHSLAMLKSIVSKRGICRRRCWITNILLMKEIIHKKSSKG